MHTENFDEFLTRLLHNLVAALYANTHKTCSTRINRLISMSIYGVTVHYIGDRTSDNIVPHLKTSKIKEYFPTIPLYVIDRNLLYLEVCWYAMIYVLASDMSRAVLWQWHACGIYWGRDKIVAVSQTTLSNAFSWMKMLEFLS